MPAKIITLHLVNGAFIKEGISTDPSMGTRSGDLYPTIIFYILSKSYSPVNKKSGMLASDMLEAYKKESTKAKFAYAYRINKSIVSYIATGNVLSIICDEMDFLGIRLYEKKNPIKASGIIEIQYNKSSGQILIIPPEEEIEIAIEVFSSLSDVVTCI